MIFFRRTVALLVFVGFAGSLGAQGLGEAAQREKERRAKLKAEQPPAKTYGDAELRSATGNTFTQVEGAPPTSSSGSSSPSSGPSSSPTTRPASQGRDALAQLEQRVSDLEKRRAALPPGPFGPSIPCQEGAVVTPGSTSVQLRDSPKVKVCDPNLLREQEARRVQIELDQARAALEKARKQ